MVVLIHTLKEISIAIPPTDLAKLWANTNHLFFFFFFFFCFVPRWRSNSK